MSNPLHTPNLTSLWYPGLVTTLVSVHAPSVPGIQLIVDCVAPGVYAVEAVNHAVLRSSGVRRADVSDLVSVADQAMADVEGSA